MRIEYYRDAKDGLWYFRVVSRNNKIVAQGEGYKRLPSLKKTIQAIRINLDSAPLVAVDE